MFAIFKTVRKSRGSNYKNFNLCQRYFILSSNQTICFQSVHGDRFSSGDNKSYQQLTDTFLLDTTNKCSSFAFTFLYFVYFFNTLNSQLETVSYPQKTSAYLGACSSFKKPTTNRFFPFNIYFFKVPIGLYSYCSRRKT